MSWQQRFQALDRFLLQHADLWRPRPFTHLRLPWEDEHVELAHWLRQRPLSAVDRDINPLSVPGAPTPFPVVAREASELASVEPLKRHSVETHSRLPNGIPGRKWQQIQSFAECVEFEEPPSHWLDWCAGKGHLGRLLARQHTPLTCLERDQALIDAGKAESEKLNIGANHVAIDVMAEEAEDRMLSHHTPVALHACGDLHVRMMELAAHHGCRQLAISPCCYNRIQGDAYRPLSTAAKNSGLTLTRQDLALPQRETVTAGATVRRRTHQSMAWRLGFDLLQRELRGIDDYLPTPSLGSAYFRSGFEYFCRQLGALNMISIPEKVNWRSLEQRGWQRLAEVRNLELVSDLFRRPLEVWLVLDRAMMLEEHGYEVRLGTFCDRRTTPRNTLILAQKSLQK